MATLNQVWVFAENESALSELSTGAAQLGQDIAAVIAGDRRLADIARTYGISKVFYLGDYSEGRTLETYFDSLLSILKDKKPDLVLVEKTKNGRLLAGKMAAALQTCTLTDALELSVHGDAVQSVRMVYGGAGFRTEKVKAGNAFALVGGGIFEATAPGAGTGEIVDVPFIQPVAPITCVGRRPKVGQSVNLAASKRVVGVGRGFSSQDQLQLAKELATAIGGEVGCSRPLAEEEGWLPKELYIGVSGVMLKADVYFALGISGQVQHMVGVNQSKTIVAINKDKNAPVFKQADYGLVGDLQTALPALLAKFK